MLYFIKGLSFGFVLAAIVGPISLLCIRKTLVRGRASGFASGLGAATADAIYSFVALLGLSSVAQFFLIHKQLLSLLGGLFLCFLGIRAFVVKQQAQCPFVSRGSLLKDFLGTLLLTLANPITIFTFLSFFAGLGLHEEGFRLLMFIQVGVGVFLGAVAWWAILVFFVGFARDVFAQRWIERLSKMSGIAIFIFGLSLLFSVVRFIYRK